MYPSGMIPGKVSTDSMMHSRVDLLNKKWDPDLSTVFTAHSARLRTNMTVDEVFGFNVAGSSELISVRLYRFSFTKVPLPMQNNFKKKISTNAVKFPE